MSNIVEIAFKHIPFAVEFEYENQKYRKTNFNRGYYYREGRKIFKSFKKSIVVKTNNESFDIIV